MHLQEGGLLFDPWGGGAKLKFKPMWVTTRGADGELQRTYQRKSTYVCDLGQVGGGRLRQTGLSSFMTPPGTRGGTPADVERRAIFGRTTVGPATTVDSVNEEVLSGLELNDDL